MSVKILEIVLLDECPFNPRTEFDGIEELAADIRERGMLHPLLVRPMGAGRFEVVDGARRLRALKLNKAALVDCRIRVMDALQAGLAQLAIAVHKRSLLPLDQARAFRRLMDMHSLSQADLAKSLNRSEDYVKAQLVLLRLPPAAVSAIRRGKLSPTHARYIAKLPTPEARVQAAEKFAANPMSVAKARVEMGQIPAANPNVRGQIAMRDRIGDVLRDAADRAEDSGKHEAAKIIRACARMVEKLEPIEHERSPVASQVALA